MVLGHLRTTFPDLDLSVLTAAPDVAATRARFGVPVVSVRAGAETPSRGRLASSVARVREALRITAESWRVPRRFDVVVATGGGFLEAEGSLAAGSLLAWVALVVTALAASTGGRRWVVFDVGATPQPSRLARAFSRAALRRASRRSFRDQGSRDAMVSAGGATTSDTVAADLVLSRWAASGPEPVVGRRRVGIGVMSFGWSGPAVGRALDQAGYEREIAVAVAALVAGGAEVVLFGGDRADEPVAAEVERAVAALQGGDRATGVDRVTPRTFDDLLAVVRSCDVVAGSRYHNVVGALISGLPAVAVVDRVKLRDLAWSVGLGELVHEARSLDGAALASTIELALDQRAALAARVRAAGAPLADAARNELVALDAIVRDVVAGPAISR